MPPGTDPAASPSDPGSAGGAPLPGPIQVRRYDEGTAEGSALSFQADAGDAARAGYVPTSQVWEGPALVVTYQLMSPGGTPPPYPPPSASQRTAPRVYVPAVMVGVGGILVALGSILPWVRLGTVSTGGTEGDGLITAILGAALVLIGLAGTTNPRRARQVRSLAILGGVATFLIAVVDLWNVSFERGSPVGEAFRSAVGEGLWLVLAGSVISLAGALRSTGGHDATTSRRSRRRGALVTWVVIGVIAIVAVVLLIAISGPGE